MRSMVDAEPRNHTISIVCTLPFPIHQKSKRHAARATRQAFALHQLWPRNSSECIYSAWNCHRLSSIIKCICYLNSVSHVEYIIKMYVHIYTKQNTALTCSFYNILSMGSIPNATKHSDRAWAAFGARHSRVLPQWHYYANSKKVQRLHFAISLWLGGSTLCIQEWRAAFHERHTVCWLYRGKCTTRIIMFTYNWHMLCLWAHAPEIVVNL